MPKKLTTADFVNRATKKHGGKYSYEKSVVVSSRDHKVIVTCKDHGDFRVTPDNHQRGKGCPQCGTASTSEKRIKQGLNSFVKESAEKHGNKYDYSLVCYRKSNAKVEIVCRDHGSFFQTPSSHAQGAGCPRCARHKIRAASVKGSQYFIRIARDAHGDKYDYSKVPANALFEDKVCIICPEHGSFYQGLGKHSKGKKCPSCAAPGGVPLTAESFVDRAVCVHDGKYEYALNSDPRWDDKVEIICPEHGYFFQSAGKHLQGRGCPRCLGNYGQPTQLYLLTNGEQIKVGIALDVDRRMKQHRCGGQPFTSDLVATWSLPDHPGARAVETKVHKLLAEHNAGLTGFDGATEWFNVSPQVAADAIKRCLP